MFNIPTPAEKTESKVKGFLWEKLGWLVFVLILGIFSSSLLMGIAYLVPVQGEGLDLEGKLLVLKALNIETDLDNIEQTFEENIREEIVDERVFYWAEDGSVVFSFAGMGHQANISGLLALAPTRDTVEALIILEQAETPGLGGRIMEEAFLNQFKGVAIEPEITVLPTGQSASRPNEVDGISGATMTSKALENMLRKNIREVIELLEGE